MSEIMSDGRATRRVKRLLDAMIVSRHVTDEGVRWLTVATDPFHDTDVDCNGYPDLSSARSVVQCVQTTVSVTATNAQDIHVFMLPITTPFVNAGAGYPANCLVPLDVDNTGAQIGPAPGGPALYAGVNIVTSARGAQWTAPASVGLPVPNVSIPTTYVAGQSRLVACGWEVVNTTPPINMSGSVTSYRCPSSPTQSQFCQVIGAAAPPFTEYIPTKYVTLPPVTQSDAILYPNSKTWNAAEGIYQTAVMNNLDNPFKSPTPGMEGFLQVPTLNELTSNLPRRAPANSTTVPSPSCDSK